MADGKRGAKPKMTPEKIELLEGLCRLKPTLEDCAVILKVDEKTITSWIRKVHKIKFSQFRDRHMAHTRFNLVRDLLAQSKRGSTKATIYALERMGGVDWAPRDPGPLGGGGDGMATWTLNYAIPAKPEKEK